MMKQVREFGELVYKRRIELGLTLRAFCEKTGLDPEQVSKIERLRTQPPSDLGILSSFAKGLKIKGDSTEWRTFFSLAIKSFTPKAQNEEMLARRLPVFLRSTCNSSKNEKHLRKLADILRDA